jgi:hypothetical protein
LFPVVAADPKKPSEPNWGLRITLAIFAVGFVVAANVNNFNRPRPAPVTSVRLTPSPAPAPRPLPAPGSPPSAKGLSSLFEPKATPRPTPSRTPLSQSGATTAATRLDEPSVSPAMPPAPKPPTGSLAAALDVAPGNVEGDEPARPSSAVAGKESKVVPTPATGELRAGPARGPNALLKIVTESGSNYLIKLVNLTNARDQIVIFVRGGDTFETRIPLGDYKFRAAAGQTWYGREDLFGPATQFFRLRNKTAPLEQHVLRFYQDGQRLSGNSIVLKPADEGTLQRETMSKADFDAN